MFAVIRENRDRSITRLLTCGSLEAVIVASQMEKNKVPLQDRTTIRAVALSQRDSLRVYNGGYLEILILLFLFQIAAEITRVDWRNELGGIHRDDLYDSLCKTTSQHDENRIRSLPPQQNKSQYKQDCGPNIK